jgi:hypothetical protein
VNSATGEAKKGWETRILKLSGMLDEKELATARNSTPNTYYTSSTVVSGVRDALLHLGHKTGIALDSSANSGEHESSADQSAAELLDCGTANHRNDSTWGTLMLMINSLTPFLDSNGEFTPGLGKMLLRLQQEKSDSNNSTESTTGETSTSTSTETSDSSTLSATSSMNK